MAEASRPAKPKLTDAPEDFDRAFAKVVKTKRGDNQEGRKPR